MPHRNLILVYDNSKYKGLVMNLQSLREFTSLSVVCLLLISCLFRL